MAAISSSSTAGAIATAGAAATRAEASTERARVALMALARPSDSAPVVSTMAPRVASLHAHLMKLWEALGAGNTSEIATLYSQLGPDLQKNIEAREQAIIVSRGLTMEEQLELGREIRYYAVGGLADALAYVPDIFFSGMQNLPPLLKPLSLTSTGIAQCLQGRISYVDGNVARAQDARIIFLVDPEHDDLGIQTSMNKVVKAFFRGGDGLLVEGVVRGETPSLMCRRSRWRVVDDVLKERGGIIEGWDRIGETHDEYRKNMEAAHAEYQAARTICDRLEKEASKLPPGTGSASGLREARKKSALLWKSYTKLTDIDRNASMAEAIRTLRKTLPGKKIIFVHLGAAHSEDLQRLHDLGEPFIRIIFRKATMPGFKRRRLTLPPYAGPGGLASSSSSSSTSSRGSLPALPASGPPPAYPSFSSTPAPAPAPVAAVIPAAAPAAAIASPPAPAPIPVAAVIPPAPQR